MHFPCFWQFSSLPRAPSWAPRLPLAAGYCRGHGEGRMGNATTAEARPARGQRQGDKASLPIWGDEAARRRRSGRCHRVFRVGEGAERRRRRLERHGGGTRVPEDSLSGLSRSSPASIKGKVGLRDGYGRAEGRPAEPGGFPREVAGAAALGDAQNCRTCRKPSGGHQWSPTLIFPLWTL